MTKKRSRSLFILFAIILVVCLVACFVNFTYPLSINGNYYSYSNFVSNLKLGEDVSSSLRIVYRAEDENISNFDAKLNSDMSKIKEIIQSEGYIDTTVATHGNNSILINVGNILNEEEKNNVVSLLSRVSGINFSMEDDVTKSFAGKEDIEKVEALAVYDAQNGKTVYNVSIKFNDDKKSAVADATSKGGTLYVFMGEEKFTQMDMGSTGITEGYIYIQSERFTSKEIAQTYANQIKTGLLSLDLTRTECAMVSATYGNNSNIVLSIAVGVLVIACFAFLIVKYKQLGLLACFNLLFFAVLSIFIIQSIPFANINFSGIVAILIASLLIIDGIISIFESAKRNYNSGMKLHVALEEGYKDNFMKIIISNVIIATVGLVCVFVPCLPVKSFGWVGLVMPIVGMFTTLVLMKLFNKMYLAFNNSDGKKCNFHKGGKDA